MLQHQTKSNQTKPTSTRHPALRQLGARLAAYGEEVAAAAAALQLALYRRETVLELACRSAEKVAAARTPRLCGAVAAYVAAERRALRTD